MLDPKMQMIMRLTDLILIVANRIQEVKAMSEEEAKAKLPGLKADTDELVKAVTL